MPPSYLRFQIIEIQGILVGLINKIDVFNASTVFREPSVNTMNIGLVLLEEDGAVYE